MANREMASDVKVTPALNRASITSNTTTNGTWIDTQGFGSVFFSIQSDTITDGTYTPLIEDADASNQSDAAAVADTFLSVTEASVAFVAADDNKTKKIAYTGGKRYVRLSLVSTGVTSGGGIGATAVLGHPGLGAVA
ncbi:hypothetical protein JL101_035330 (plasmid) [Skermanella rosea]|uniref:hypothetical protein n=1 Tax=Skermanella rosea TaxID=1817965 RepID=UPI0019322E11|nr:hypothetical protein [Skermanella rosea]UEM08071.1 hypothetical protein JL101_035330 [Skermanella rosea]